MGSVLQRLYRWTGRFYLLLFGLFDAGSAVVICFATVGLFALYTNISIAQFWEAVAFSELSVAIALVLTATHAVRQIRPVTGWIRRGKGTEGALEAGRTAVALPREYVIGNGWQPFLIVAGPIAIYLTVRFDLPWYSALIIFAGAVVAVGYAAVLAFFSPSCSCGRWWRTSAACCRATSPG